jgi:hypothetical protein
MKEPIVKVATAAAIKHLITACHEVDADMPAQAEVNIRTAVVILQQFADIDKLNEDQKSFVKESIRLMIGNSS